MKGARVLVVEDDALFADVLRDHLEACGFIVGVARSRRGADAMITQEAWDVLMLDNQLPDGTGLELAREHSASRDLPVVLMTAHADLGDAVDAMNVGIHDYLIKPVALPQLRFVLLKCLERARLARLARIEQRARGHERPTDPFATQSTAQRDALTLARRAASTAHTVLIHGETGSGKTMLARAIHDASSVAEGPFVAVNCGAIPGSLVEAELFGSVRGAYTGAVGRAGMFELASHGTLLLDEIAELPLTAQATLLTAIESKRIRRVGAERDTPVDVRIIAATNLDLEASCDAGRFRRDLMYRLAVVVIELPPLRARPEDLGALVQDLLGRLQGAAPEVGLADGELERLRAYDWPGNIRELRNVLERALLVAPDGHLRPSEFLRRGPRVARGDRAASAGPIRTMAEVERETILEALQHFGGHRQRAAEALGISTATLRRRLAAYRSE
ncbi:MAG: sigma-54 dependent transcriptional regulator [Myxococcota bacterium]